MPIPSHLCPHCLAKDHLRLWAPTPLALGHTHTPRISKAEQVHIKDNAAHVGGGHMGVCYALIRCLSQLEVSLSGVSSGLSALATCNADMW